MTFRPTVLLLDQDYILRRTTALLLSNRGAEVSSAATIEEAIALSWNHVYDVVVIDLAPAMLGASEILLRFRQGGFPPRRIVLCAESPCLLDNVVDGAEVLIKPYPFEQLLRSIFGARSARRRTRSGVFPRLRVVAGGLESDGQRNLSRAAGGDGKALGADDAALVSCADAAHGGAGACAEVRNRRPRGPVLGRALRTFRRAPRCSRYPE